MQTEELLETKVCSPRPLALLALRVQLIRKFGDEKAEEMIVKFEAAGKVYGPSPLLESSEAL